MDRTFEIDDSIGFQEEIDSLMNEAPPVAGGSSFTALLGLAPHQAAELLGGGVDAAILDGAKVKVEPAESGADNAVAVAGRRPAAKRKEAEKKVRSVSAKKSKSSEDEGDEKDGDGEKLPYVHVRARRGQATDSHSLAERARREKINARMKLLQELVPGCSKISGTALVLDEIINHVQSLQRQVEFLSMKLAAVNPRIDFSGLDSFLAAENPRVVACNGLTGMGLDPPLWAEVPLDVMIRRHHPHHHHQQHQQEIWQVDMDQQQQHHNYPFPHQLASSLHERTGQHHHYNGFVGSGTSLYNFDSPNTNGDEFNNERDTKKGPKSSINISSAISSTVSEPVEDGVGSLIIRETHTLQVA